MQKYILNKGSILFLILYGLSFVSYSQLLVDRYKLLPYHGNYQYQLFDRVEVYSKDEINIKNTDFDKRIYSLEERINQNSVKINEMDQRLSKDLNNMKTELDSLITSSINKLPQRLLSDEVKKTLKAELGKELILEIEEFRKDLQKQIDRLKQ